MAVAEQASRPSGKRTTGRPESERAERRWSSGKKPTATAVTQSSPSLTEPARRDDGPSAWLIDEWSDESARATAAEALGAEQASKDESEVLAARRRKTTAVEAYCAEVCSPAVAAAAAAAALSSFNGDDDRELLRLTRRSAANHVSDSAERRPAGAVPGTERERGCEATPALLASRANGELGSGESGWLQQHLHDCLVCQASEVRMLRAERAFAGLLGVDVAAAPRAADVPSRVARRQTLARATANDSMAVVPAAAAGPATAEAGPVSAAVVPARRRRLLTLGLAAAGLTLLVGAAIAAALVAGGASKHHTPRAAVVTSPARTPTVAPARRPAPKSKPAAHKRHGANRAGRSAAPAAHAASSAQTSPPATASPEVKAASPAPTPSTSSPAPSTSSSAPQSNPTPSSSSNSSSASSSIQQPSLGATSAPQGVGKSKP